MYTPNGVHVVDASDLPSTGPDARHDDHTARFVDDRDNLNLGAAEAAMQADDTVVNSTRVLRGKTYEVRRFCGFREFQLIGNDGWTVASPELAELIDELLGQHDDYELVGSIAAPMSMTLLNFDIEEGSADD